MKPVEILPSLRLPGVHHAVVYVRPPESKWMRHAPVGVPFTASMLTDPEDRRGAHWTDSDVLLVYAPGVRPTIDTGSLATVITAGSRSCFSDALQYQWAQQGGDQSSSVGLICTKPVPAQQRVLTRS